MTFDGATPSSFQKILPVVRIAIHKCGVVMKTESWGGAGSKNMVEGQRRYPKRSVLTTSFLWCLQGKSRDAKAMT